MAKVVAAKDVERTLQMALHQWEALPRVEAEIDDWEQIDQIVFIEEWPLEEQRLKRLERYVQEGHMTKDQMARYEGLKCIVARNRPIIQKLRNS